MTSGIVFLANIGILISLFVLAILSASHEQWLMVIIWSFNILYVVVINIRYYKVLYKDEDK